MPCCFSYQAHRLIKTPIRGPDEQVEEEDVDDEGEMDQDQEGFEGGSDGEAGEEHR